MAPSSASKVPRVGVGVILTRSDGRILIGRRKGGAEPGTWALPGGKLEHGETFEQCAKRELLEEANLEIDAVQFVWACSTVLPGQEHWVTIFVEGVPSQPNTQPEVMEPDKCYEWKWVSCNEVPHPRFTPFAHLLDSGFLPSAHRMGTHVRLADAVCSSSGHQHLPSAELDLSWDTSALEIAPAVQPSGFHPSSFSGGVFSSRDGKGTTCDSGGVITLAPAVFPSKPPESET